jgi:hypothetical protein
LPRLQQSVTCRHTLRAAIGRSGELASSAAVATWTYRPLSLGLPLVLQSSPAHVHPGKAEMDRRLLARGLACLF